MQVQVSVNKLNAKTRDYLNENEYQVHKIEFEFTEDYTDDLVKVAVFKQGGKNYKVNIENGECNIPAEILAKKGTFALGVYAYAIENEELTLRYSPSPISLFISSGSYVKDEDTENSEPLTPTDKELIMSRLEQVEFDAEQVETNTQDISDLKETKADKSEIEDLGGVEDYPDLNNLPSINGVTLLGNKTTDELGIESGKPQVIFWDGKSGQDAINKWDEIYQAHLNSDILVTIMQPGSFGSRDQVFNYGIKKNSLVDKTSYSCEFYSDYLAFNRSSSNGTHEMGINCISASLTIDNGHITNVVGSNWLSTNPYIKTNYNYPQPYMPQYNGSPATKKYVDDAITTAISQITDGDEVSY